MKKKCLRLIALLCLTVLLSGCGWTRPGAGLRDALAGDNFTAYEDMVYTRPNMEAVEQSLAVAVTAAQGRNVEHIIRMVYAFYDIYDGFYTNYSLADIRYCMDLTDIYWETEYNFCMENSARVDAALEELYYALAKSPCLEELESEVYFGEGYFDSYQGENNWDAEFTALMEEESRLISRYYELAALGADYEMGSEAYYGACGEDMAQLLVDLILARKALAEYWDYEDYARFATDFYYYRDYSVEESRQYLDGIRQELVPVYRRLNATDVWDAGDVATTEEETLRFVREMAKAMGGTVLDAFEFMEKAKVYDISYSENKYPSSFEIYLTSYDSPFLFMNPGGTVYDHLTLAHEFGHFCNDYASYGSYAGVDVLEIFSQGMEYLSLCYAPGGEELEKLKLADSLSLYVEQAAYAFFEMELYRIPENELTVQALYDLYDRVALAFGFDSIGYDKREFVTINHYYTNPMYILSYVVSNDAAMQLYQMEQTEPGTGLRTLEENLTTQEIWFLSFLKNAGLESPFAPGRLERVREMLEESLF